MQIQLTNMKASSGGRTAATQAIRWVLLLQILQVMVCWPHCHAIQFNATFEQFEVTLEVEQQPTMEPITSRFPKEITLRAAVLHAPPFATVEELPDGSVIYGGFQPDLLKRLQVFAAADNVTLNWNLSVSLPQYGSAMDLVANDCEAVVENPEHNCGWLDMIVGNYYATPERAVRVDLSPAWLRSTISTVKYAGKTGKDYTTLAQAEEDMATVCLKNGTFYATLVKAKFPKINYFMCPALDECLNELKNETCVLYADDELQLRFKTAWDPSLEMTPETFNTQYIVWPTSFNLDPIVSILLNRWVLKAVTNATLDELYSTYFQKALCPVGTAGEHCELPCDADHGAADSRGVCICQSNKYTGDDCSIEVPEDTNLIPPSLLGMAYAMLGINITVIVGCSLWLIWQRNTAQVQVSQPFFLYLVLSGCLISSMTILPLAQQHEGDGPVHACMAIPWLYSVGFSITFGAFIVAD
jgi:Bacterial extracellular solute-binding proteins, family 3/7 transmembrane sweet-taste receptor of 3 GCPR